MDRIAPIVARGRAHRCRAGAPAASARSGSRERSSEYIAQVSEPAIKAVDLRDASRRRYRLSLQLLVGDCTVHAHESSRREHTIASGTRFRALEACLSEIAQLHGSETARQCRTVLGRHVLQQLIRDEAIAGNPLAGIRVDLRSSKQKPAGLNGGPRQRS